MIEDEPITFPVIKLGCNPPMRPDTRKIKEVMKTAEQIPNNIPFNMDKLVIAYY